MKNTNLIKQERKRKDLSQKELAELINVDRTTITRYENGQTVPYEALEKIAEVLNSNKLRLNALGCVIPCFYLDNIDLHPLAVKQKGIEELKEALANLAKLDLINKLNAENFKENGIEDLIETILSLQDVNMCINHILISFSETYDIDLDKIGKLSKEKMKRKGYLKGNKRK